MQWAFITVAVFGLVYFLLGKRRFGFLSLAYLGAVVYFMPGFVGYTSAPSRLAADYRTELPLQDEAYVVMIAVLVAIIVAGWQRQLVDARRPYEPLPPVDPRDPYPTIAFVVAVFGFAMTVVTTGSTLLVASKAVMLDGLNRWHIVFVTAATLSAALAATYRRPVILWASIGLLLFDVFIGFRTSFVIMLLTLSVLHLRSKGPQRVALAQWKFGLGALVLGGMVFVYKRIYIAVKLGRWDLVSEVLTTPRAYTEAVLSSEPFVTQSILNEVIRHDFRVGLDHLSEAALQFALFSDLLGVETTSFTARFQPMLFSGVDGGLASNIWAEMWSAGDWWLLSIFIVVFVLVTGVGNRFIDHRSPFVRAGAAVLLTTWAFYVHRNGLAYQLNLEKRTALIWLTIGALGYLGGRTSIVRLAPSGRGSSPPPPAPRIARSDPS